MKKDVYAVYAPSADISFIMCDEYENGELISTEVIGWYYGEPNEDDDCTYAGITKAEF